MATKRTKKEEIMEEEFDDEFEGFDDFDDFDDDEEEVKPKKTVKSKSKTSKKVEDDFDDDFEDEEEEEEEEVNPKKTVKSKSKTSKKVEEEFEDDEEEDEDEDDDLSTDFENESDDDFDDEDEDEDDESDEDDEDEDESDDEDEDESDDDEEEEEEETTSKKKKNSSKTKPSRKVSLASKSEKIFDDLRENEVLHFDKDDHATNSTIISEKNAAIIFAAAVEENIDDFSEIFDKIDLENINADDIWALVKYIDALRVNYMYKRGIGHKFYTDDICKATIRGCYTPERVFNNLESIGKAATKTAPYVKITMNSPAPEGVKTKGIMQNGEFTTQKPKKKTSKTSTKKATSNSTAKKPVKKKRTTK